MKLSLCLVVLLGASVCLVNAACPRKDTVEGVVQGTLSDVKGSLGMESEESGVQDFFKKIGCGIVDAGRTVGDSVQSGYEYVKDKLTPNKEVKDIDVRGAMDDLKDKVKS